MVDDKMRRDKIYLFQRQQSKPIPSFKPSQRRAQSSSDARVKTVDPAALDEYQVMILGCLLCGCTLNFDDQIIRTHCKGKRHSQALKRKFKNGCPSEISPYYGCGRMMTPGCPICDIFLQSGEIPTHQHHPSFRRQIGKIHSFEVQIDETAPGYIFIDTKPSVKRVGCATCLLFLALDETIAAHEATSMHQLLFQVAAVESTMPSSSSSHSSIDPLRYFRSLFKIASNGC